MRRWRRVRDGGVRILLEIDLELRLFAPCTVERIELLEG